MTPASTFLRRTALLAAVVLFALPAFAEAQARLLRHPSYHNGKVAFSYLGDIWVADETGSNPQRLTVHTARDVFPRFSPDGKWIAFSSNRYGNYDVYVIPATGGPAKQLTFHSGGDMVVGWSRDGKKVMFTANRGVLFPGIPSLLEISVTGGLEEVVKTDWGAWGDYSPDGTRLAFNRHPMTWWRKHYRGSYAADLWVMDVAQKKFRRLGDGDYKGNYFWPMYGANGDIYFVADRMSDESKAAPGSLAVMKSVNNIWKMSDKGGAAVQVTKHTGGHLFFPSISSDGKVIVYEENFGLWKLDTATGKTSEIKVNIASDDKENAYETVTVRNDTEDYDLSPSSKRAAIVARGEIFSIATDRGDIQRVTESYARESSPVWSPDGKWIAFISDRGGHDDVWVAAESGAGARQLSNSDTEKRNLQWTPDSKALIYAASDRNLYRVEVESGASKAIASTDSGFVLAPSVSPDGKWVAYAKLDFSQRPHIYVSPATGGEERHVGHDDMLFAETSPVWTRDGKRLLFLAGLAQVGAATQRRNFVQLYSVSLQKERKSLTDRGVDTEEEAQAAERSARPARRGEGGEGGAEKVEVKIDFDGITRRTRQLTRLNDNVSAVAVSPDSKLIAFVVIGDQEGRTVATLYTIQEDGTQLTRVTQTQGGGGDGEGPGFGGGANIRSLSFAKDGRAIYFMEGNGLYTVDVSSVATAAASGRTGGPGAGGGGGRSFDRRRINFTARVEVDARAEWKQVFAESWRIMKNRFYDADMHGVDWKSMRATYEPLMAHVADQEEMHNVVSQMIGELNASHTGISAPAGPEARDRVQTRYPGFEMQPDASGFYRVSKIYKDGPADKDYVTLAVGDYILAIDGKPLKSGDNYFQHLNGLRGQKFEFTVNAKPGAEGAWKTKIEPANAGAYATMQYEAWVAERRAMVDKLSNGQVGYLHIRAMNAPSLRQFERDLVANQNKKALVIDQRFNPGGSIDQELLQILGQRQYQKTRGRGMQEITRPQQGFFGPMVVMQNERSTSDAEVFPDGFRTLGLGKVIGVPTYGAVIGTGSYRLMDGSNIRTPATGLWNVAGYNLENYGVPPDIEVDNTPEDFLAGRDRQLEKAVEVLMMEVQQKQPVKVATQD